MSTSTIAGVAAAVSGILGAAGFSMFSILHINARAAARNRQMPEIITALKASSVTDPKDLPLPILRAILKSEADLSDKIIQSMVSPDHRSHARLSLISSVGLFAVCAACLALWYQSSRPSIAQNSDSGSPLQPIATSSVLPDVGPAEHTPSSDAIDLDALYHDVDIDGIIDQHKLTPQLAATANHLVKTSLQNESTVTYLVSSEWPHDIVVDIVHAVCFLVPYLPADILGGQATLDHLDTAVSNAIPVLSVADKLDERNVSRQVQVFLLAIGDRVSADALSKWAAKDGEGEGSPPHRFTPSRDTRLVFVSSTNGDDTYSGLTPAEPKRTLHAALMLARKGKPDWILLKRGNLYRAEGRLPMMVGRGPGEEVVIGSYDRGDDPILILPDPRNYNWPDSEHAIIVGIQVVR